MTDKKYIYIVLTKNHTLLSQLITLVTKSEYAHASITFNPDCSLMYSFGRKYVYTPFWGTFKKENIRTGIFAINRSNKIKIYQLEIDIHTYNKILDNINLIANNNKGYNTIGLFLGLFNKRIKRNKYYCSEFVYEILNKDVNLIKDIGGSIKPNDLLCIDGLNLLYEGKIQNYIKYIQYIKKVYNK